MRQFFHRRSNTVFALVLLAAVIVPAGVGIACWIFRDGSYKTGVGVARIQPVPFSHEHHVNLLGLDCRNCHTSVETSNTAGMPPTQTCMTCHSQIWKESPLLEPVRKSFLTNQPIHWKRVHRLPEYVFFNHSIHVRKGVGCTSCHAHIDQMPLVWKTRSFWMSDCLSCHRHPEQNVRPLDQVFNPRYRPPADPKKRAVFGRELIARNHVRTKGLTECYTCHR